MTEDSKPPRYPKQVLVVRKDLKMRKGKIAAQCAHASLGVILDLMQDVPQVLHYCERTLTMKVGDPLEQWVNGIFTKVCVYVESEEHLRRLHTEAQDLGLNCKLITDAGKTEFHGVPTATVLAIGPDWNDDIDKVTGKLPLL